MPNVRIPVETTDSTITRLVAKSIITELLYDTNSIPLDDIIYIQRGGKNIIAQPTANAEPRKLDVGDYFQVEYTEKYLEDYFDPNITQSEFPVIFRDTALGIQLAPMHKRVKLTLNATFRVKSYDTLTQWLNAFKNKITLTQSNNYHDLYYNYTIPDAALAYINCVYQLTESVAPYGNTLAEYLKLHFSTQGIVVRQNMTGTQQSTCVNVKNMNCLGFFSQEPEDQTTSTEPPISEITFTYEVIYDKVSAINLTYQLYIHNQIVDVSYLAPYTTRTGLPVSTETNMTVSQAVNYVTNDSSVYVDPNLPANDGWRPDSIYRNMSAVFNIPIKLDSNDLTNVIDINDLVNYSIPEQLITYMLLAKSYIFLPYQWVVYIECYEVGSSIRPVPLIINTNETIIRSQYPLDLRKRHYLRLLSNFDLSKMDFSLLRLNYDMLLYLLQWLNYQVTLNKLGLNSVSTLSIQNAINLIGKTDLKSIQRNNVQFTTLYARI